MSKDKKYNPTFIFGELQLSGIDEVKIFAKEFPLMLLVVPCKQLILNLQLPRISHLAFDENYFSIYSTSKEETNF